MVPAKEQGKIAGFNMCGIKTEYCGSNMAAKLKVSGINLFSCGKIDFSNDNCFEKQESDYYFKIFKQDNEIKGALALGRKEIVDLTEKVFLKKESEKVLSGF